MKTASLVSLNAYGEIPHFTKCPLISKTNSKSSKRIGTLSSKVAMINQHGVVLS